MTSTPPKLHTNINEILGESWIELTSTAAMMGMRSPERITPQPFSSSEEYLRLLREAQRESNQSSRVVSLASSRRDTPRDSPKSPPNSPNNELHNDDHLKNIYINYWSGARLENDQAAKDTDWIWEWSSRPDQMPPKDWKFEHPHNQQSQNKKFSGYSMRQARIGKNSLFSREILYSLILTNVLSLLLGTGLGLWLSKRFLANLNTAGVGGGTTLAAITKF